MGVYSYVHLLVLAAVSDCGVRGYGSQQFNIYIKK
jgi:hypothetical protein